MLFNGKKMQDEGKNDYSGSYTSEPRPAAGEPAALNQTPTATAVRKPGSAPTRSVIDSWLTITGNLQSEGEVQVEGQINGDIRCAQLIVGKDATVNGNIIAEDVIVRGKVKGTIRAHRVTLQDTAVADSEIFHKSLAIEQGACFEGMSRRSEDPMTAGMTEAQLSSLQAMAAGMKDRSMHNGMGRATAAA